ncbi:MAG: four helix bundle protein [Longimicrobiales bacterium]|nr:four helix bundle protein [Longimicrobiales bacterium]
MEGFDYKELDAYQATLDFFGWAVEVTGRVPWKFRAVGDQFIGASVSILGNIGEASGRRRRPAESSQHYRYAQGSTHECAAYLDALACMEVISETDRGDREAQLARIGAMITRLIDLQERRRTRSR